MIKDHFREESALPSPRPSYLIFLDMYRERYGEDEWSEEWSYRADCVNWNDTHNIVIATGREGFARAISRQLQGLISFNLGRKSCKAVTAGIKSYDDHSEQIALPDDNELAELETLIRSHIDENNKRKQAIDVIVSN